MPETGGTAVLGSVALLAPTATATAYVGPSGVGSVLAPVQGVRPGLSMAAPTLLVPAAGYVQVSLSAGSARAVVDVLGYYVG